MHLQCCVNGSRTRLEHPAVPLTADAIAADAARISAAGATSLHVHPRAADGSESLDPASVGTVIAAMRSARPELGIGVTTAAWIEPDPARRLAAIAAWDPVPDFASVNLSEDGYLDVVDLLNARGVGVEAGVWTEDDAREFVKRGLDAACDRLLVEVEAADGAETAVALASRIDLILDDGLVETPRLHHGSGRATWAVIASAVEHGHDVRVGLEDTLVMPDGSVAADNASLVEACAALARAAGRLPNH
ncbi:MAG: 3-keto-5-aminohexanoate cleavage protein [Candidatus Dormibacteraeota bacterium]|nr:3-keto-5-aminohexanoate cleavage protein [Candidatus Dormibacteraeota bacterium]